MSQPLLRLVGLWTEFQQADIAVKRLGDILDVPVEPYALTPARPGGGAGRIEIDNLAFRYSAAKAAKSKGARLDFPAPAYYSRSMPRRPRIHLDGVPLHIVQRGHNRQPCFFAEEDYHAYLHWLGEALRKQDCALHAYVLMTNHVHLLLTPKDAAAVPRLIIALGRRYVQYINTTYRRTGTLWDSRYKSSLVQADPYLLACQRYIELNPELHRV
jgi:REP element-mobilizing transposase RayT